jgi:imidazolonepropionase-like amidohydrolase
VIAPGKLADLILIEGDPTSRIGDIHKIVTVIKAGHVFDPAQIERSLGISARKTPAK